VLEVDKVSERINPQHTLSKPCSLEAIWREDPDSKRERVVSVFWSKINGYEWSDRVREVCRI
jgi:hypothetical protein